MDKLYLKLSRLFCVLLIAGASLPAFPQAQMPLDTTDKFVISELETDINGETYFTVSLDGGDQGRLYCAYNMTLTLPIGISFATYDGKPKIGSTKDSNFYPYTEVGLDKNFDHTVASALSGTTGRVAKIICSSNNNAIFKATSGPLFVVYVVVSPWARAGVNEVVMTGLNLTTKENAQKYIPQEDLNTGNLTISGENRKVVINITSASKWGTCILPFAHNPGPDFKAYSVASVTSEEVVLTEVEEMEAYTPYLLYAENGYSTTLTGTAYESDFPNDAIVNDNGLCGSIVAGEASEGYILQDKGDGAKFYKIGNTPFAIKAGKCYLAPLSSGSYMLRIRREETSVNNITIDNNVKDIYYNLSGQQVSNPEPGVYIHNGKKQFKTK